jgi:outer membrane protein OmpA-like peptidoglycan-associated protein
MSSIRSRLLAAAAVLALAPGCARELGRADPWLQSGASVADAEALQSGGRAPQPTRPGRLTVLARTFAAEAEPTVTFGFGSAALEPDALAALAGQAFWLAAHPDAAVRVTGHADAVGASAANERLGLARAEAVARELVALGVPRDRIAAVASLGERDPAVMTAEAERLNRRTVTEVAWLGTVPRSLPPHDGVRARRAFQNYQDPEVRVTTTEATGGATE